MTPNTHIHINTHICTYIHTYTYTHIHTYTHTHTHTHALTWSPGVLELPVGGTVFHPVPHERDGVVNAVGIAVDDASVVAPEVVCSNGHAHRTWRVVVVVVVCVREMIAEDG